jgi:U3 small nucleolar RNA-associated protein 22
MIEDESDRASGIEQDEGWGGFGDGGERSETEGDALGKDETKIHAGQKERKPPTGQEVRVIKDAADLFRSNSFRLQVGP